MAAKGFPKDCEVMAYVCVEQANRCHVIGSIRNPGSGFLADIHWRRNQCAGDSNHSLAGFELCVVAGVGVCLDVRPSASTREEHLDLDGPVLYRPVADVNGVCVDPATSAQVTEN